MVRLRVFMVDDEPLARERLRAWLREGPSVEIVGECGGGTETIATLRNTPLGLVPLDVEMTGGDGLQMFGELPAMGGPPSFLSRRRTFHPGRVRGAGRPITS